MEETVEFGRFGTETLTRHDTQRRDNLTNKTACQHSAFEEETYTTYEIICSAYFHSSINICEFSI